MASVTTFLAHKSERQTIFFCKPSIYLKKKTHTQNTYTIMSMSAYVHSIISLVHMDKKDSFDAIIPSGLLAQNIKQ